MGSFKAKLLVCILLSANAFAQKNIMLNYVERFNKQDSEYVKNLIDNKGAYNWMAANIPVFQCPDSAIEQTYYYRWWTFRKHLKQSADGYIFTEFITPVKHAGRYNALSCAFGHHVYEGRWLRDTQYINQYIRYW